MDCLALKKSKLYLTDEFQRSLEQHWNGSLLDTVDTVLNFVQSLEFKGHRPVVKLVTQVYELPYK